MLTLIYCVSCFEMGIWVRHTNMEFSFSNTFEEANLMLVSFCLNLNHLDGLILMNLMRWTKKCSHILLLTNIFDIMLCVFWVICVLLFEWKFAIVKNQDWLLPFLIWIVKISWHPPWTKHDRWVLWQDIQGIVLKNYIMMYSISNENVQEIKIKLVLKCDFNGQR